MCPPWLSTSASAACSRDSCPSSGTMLRITEIIAVLRPAMSSTADASALTPVNGWSLEGTSEPGARLCGRVPTVARSQSPTAACNPGSSILRFGCLARFTVRPREQRLDAIEETGTRTLSLGPPIDRRQFIEERIGILAGRVAERPRQLDLPSGRRKQTPQPVILCGAALGLLPERPGLVEKRLGAN